MSKRIPGEPFPFRLFEPEKGQVQELNAIHGMNKSEVVRRCLRFALPKFLNGEADITRVVAGEAATTKPEEAK